MIHGFDDTDKTKVDLLNFFYPVGTIYETSNASFNPNDTWGGTWVKVSGKFLLASGNGYNIGTTGGAASADFTPQGTVGGHALTLAEMPSHNHSVSIAGYSTERGTLGGGSGIVSDYVGDPVSGNTGSKGSGNAHNHSFTGKKVTLSNMPPYEVVNVWKRTA